MKMRLDKYLSNMGVGSRKEVKAMIQKNMVTVNGAVVTVPKKIVDTEDDITVSGEAIAFQAYVYLMLNKPQGVISATRGREETVLDLVPESYRHRDLFPVGRLDKDTVGLLLITDDGRLGQQLLSPKNHVAKRYLATVDADIPESAPAAFQAGFDLEPEGVHTKPADLAILDARRAIVTIHEGKYHQVKRMFAFVGTEVIHLKRLSMGSLALDESLAEGEIRELTEDEIAALQNDVDKKPDIDQR